MSNKKKIAIIGSGISGIVSAYLLKDFYDVTLIEASARLGGHTYSVPIKDPTLSNAHIDMGFIVFNLDNYPLFTQFLTKLKVPYQDSDMSFGFYEKATQFYYSSDVPKGLFANKRNLVSPGFWRFLMSISQYNQQVQADIQSKQLNDLTVGQYLNERKFSKRLMDHYILPMGAAIWSCPKHEILTFPASAFFNFWQNHHLLTLGKRPTWKTIKGGSHQYINAFKSEFKGEIHLNSPVNKIVQLPQSVQVHMTNQVTIEVDYAIVATHADQALRLLEKASPLQRRLLGAWSYSNNQVDLHSDPSVMPPKRQAWASWSVQQSRIDSSLQMSYYMNRLQQLQSPHDYLVSLNHRTQIQSKHIKHQVDFTHPIYNQASVATQSRLPELNEGRVLFCGSYFGNGFHEDGVRSALHACQQLEGSLCLS